MNGQAAEEAEIVCVGIMRSTGCSVQVLFCKLFIFPRTDLYIHDSINTMFQCTQVTM